MSDKHPGGRRFKTEKEMCDYIELNVDKFCKDALDVNYLSHKRESFINYKHFGANKPRIDFDIQTDRGRFLVEVKNPTGLFSELTRAISQLLAYGVLADPEDTTLVLVTSRVELTTIKVIDKYELPIKIVYLNEVLATWDIDFQKRLNAGEVQVEEQYAIS